MPTQCTIKPLLFEGHGRRGMVAAFDGGSITSDAGLLLLRRVEQRLSRLDDAVQFLVRKPVYVCQSLVNQAYSSFR